MGVLLWHLISHRKLSWSLTGFFLGAALGCFIMFSAPGYANVNQEGYRQVSATFEELMKVIKTNFNTITMYLTERNWFVIAPLTVLSICLLLPVKVQGIKGGIRILALTALMVCPVWFYANLQIMKPLFYAEWVGEMAFWIDLLVNLMYLLAVLAAAVPAIFGPLVVVTPIGPRCMYIPYMLLAAILLIFATELVERCPRDSRKMMTIPVALTMVCVLSVYLWTAVWNGHCERVRISSIEAAMDAGQTSVVLPSYPYTDYVHNGNSGAIRYYYYYEIPCDLEFKYILHQDWFQN